MTKLETLEDFIRRKEMKPYDMVDINSLYSKNERVQLSPKITGYNISQTFCREDLKIFFAYDEYGVPILYGDTTKTKLTLSGKTGAMCGISTINLACVPYSNLEKGLYARATTKEDIINIRNTEEGKIMLNNMKKSAWLASPCYRSYIDSMNFGMYYIYSDYMEICDLYYSNYSFTGSSKGIRPVISIYFPSEIYVDKERSGNGKWVLVPERM